MKLAVLFSGGKDSVFACYRAMEKHDVVCLISIISSNEESYMFHTPNINLANYQADAMNIPLVPYKTEGEKEVELEDLKKAIEKAKDEFAIEGIVTGAIESVYQASRIQKVCKDLGIRCFNPIWKINQVEYLHLLIDKGFKILISGVFAYPFDEKWLGRVIDNKMIEELIDLQKKFDINPSGEGGEIETFVFDGPIFKKKIEIKKSSTSYENHAGVFNIEEVEVVDK